MKKPWLKGLYDGLPIGLGYLSVSFAFGIFATGSGLSILETLLLSMTNVTSAGQFAAVPIMALGGSLLELMALQLVINARYALMGVSLSQKLGPSVRPIDRLLLAFVNTDEVFAVASSQTGMLTRQYMYGLILLPYLGWSLGTLLGAAAGDLLPAMLISALGVAIYGMFVAIWVPGAKKHRPTALCILLSILLSCMFRFVPPFTRVPSGFAIILSAAFASALMAAVAPMEEREEPHA